LKHLEETFGREAFDQFVRGYFDHFAFQSITTAQFVDYLKKNLLDKNPQLAAKIPVDEWIFKPGIPASAPRAVSDAFPRVEKEADAWQKGELRASDLKTSEWTTQEWLHFLRHLPEQLDRSKMEELDKSFRLTGSGNSEIAHQWLLMSIRNRYELAYPKLEEYLITIGRRKLIKPLYDELAKTPEGRERAAAIYRKARPGYHPIAVTTLDEVLKWEKK
jgi:leukotriene-A4 hydrolase